MSHLLFIMPKRRRGAAEVDMSKDGAAAKDQHAQGNGSRKRGRSEQKDKRRKGAKTPSSTHKAFARLHRKGGEGPTTVHDLPDNVMVLIFRQAGLHRLRAVQGKATPEHPASTETSLCPHAPGIACTCISKAFAIEDAILACAVCKRWRALGSHPQFSHPCQAGPT